MWVRGMCGGVAGGVGPSGRKFWARIRKEGKREKMWWESPPKSMLASEDISIVKIWLGLTCARGDQIRHPNTRFSGSFSPLCWWRKRLSVSADWTLYLPLQSTYKHLKLTFKCSSYLFFSYCPYVETLFMLSGRHIFRPKIPFWRILQWKMLVYFGDIRSTLRPFNMFYGHMVYFVVIWYIFPCFGMLYQEKSGNPALQTKLLC
jgi:hypothetical protein